ncbi:hypothetical protein PR048_031329 [Dryococelus australis]|uniref:Cullin family profile domain-containing protein n=1 Tax=Dryococelus australis TaxID=614101 RepID=A0ABQ9G628_9NEOP|nr:hypothetical protein PR048_031329 [Dryococelus australis]
MSLVPKAENFDEKWDKLQKTIEKLVSLENVSRKLWNDHFSDIYFLCVANPQPFTERLYNETKKFLHNHVKMISAQLLESSCNDIVINYYIAWIKYSVGVRHLHSLFLYLNIQYVKFRHDPYVQTIQEVSNNGPECMVIGELALTMWKTHVIAVVKDILIDSLFKGIISFKIHSSVSDNKQVYQGSVESFVLVEDYKKKDNLKFYQDICEEPYLERCGIFFEIKSRHLWQECDANQYFKIVWQLFEEEKQCCTEFLHCSTLKKVEALFVKYMVTDHLALLHEECRSLVQQEQFSNLRMMYVLLRLVSNEVKVLASDIFEHIKVKGEEAITALTGDESDIQFIENCLALHEKYSNIIRNFFENDQTLMSALDKACSFLVNKRQTYNICRSPEILAKYCDVLLKKSCKGLSDAELEEKLVKSMIIFRYIDDKDIFQKCYSRLLAKRLIHQLSQSLDAEETMINKLKQACGYEFTNNLHRMFTDVKVSSDMNSEFSEFLVKENVDLGLSFYICVFQAASWPLSQIPLTPVALPMQLEKAVHMFDKFYHHHFSCRKLTFLHNLCQVEVKLIYLKKCYVVSMQMFQMVILLQFENLNVLRYSELQEATQLTDEQFTKLIKSLVDSKLIICTDQVPNESSLFHLNLKYVNKRTKFRIAVATQRESVQEVEQTLASVEKDRTLYLQAAIVRVMKSRKLLDHNSLVYEILSMCKERFIPEVSIIKKAIEYLIERQYIEVAPNSPFEYSYVA